MGAGMDNPKVIEVGGLATLDIQTRQGGLADLTRPQESHNRRSAHGGCYELEVLGRESMSLSYHENSEGQSEFSCSC